MWCPSTVDMGYHVREIMFLSSELSSENLLTENNGNDNCKTRKSDYFQWHCICNVILLFVILVDIQTTEV